MCRTIIYTYIYNTTVVSGRTSCDTAGDTYSLWIPVDAAEGESFSRFVFLSLFLLLLWVQSALVCETGARDTKIGFVHSHILHSVSYVVIFFVKALHAFFQKFRSFNLSPFIKNFWKFHGNHRICSRSKLEHTIDSVPWTDRAICFRTYVRTSSFFNAHQIPVYKTHLWGYRRLAVWGKPMWGNHEQKQQQQQEQESRAR